MCQREVVTTVYYLSLFLEFDLNFSTPFHKDLNLEFQFERLKVAIQNLAAQQQELYSMSSSKVCNYRW